MPFNAGSINAKLVLDTKGFAAGLSKAKGGMDDLGKRAKVTSEQVRAMGMAFTAIGVGITAASGYMVKLAMDAEEVDNLFSVSMGNMEESTRAWVNELNSSLGFSRTEIKKSVGTFNVMLSSMGLTEKQAVEMSKSMTMLAYDMMSFYDLSIEDAFLKLQSGITGEIEPLKRFGILVNENTIKAYALREGMIKQGETMTEQQKIFARYGSIMEQTANAQGDLIRTQDSLTNQLRIAKSRVVDISEELGKGLLPIVRSFTQLLNKAFEATQKFVIANEDLVVALAVTTASFGLLAFSVGGLIIAIPILTKVMGVSALALVVLSAKVALATGGLSLVAGAIAYFIKKAKEGNTEIKGLREQFRLLSEEEIAQTESSIRIKIAAINARIQELQSLRESRPNAAFDAGRQGTVSYGDPLQMEREKLLRDLDAQREQLQAILDVTKETTKATEELGDAISRIDAAKKKFGLESIASITALADELSELISKGGLDALEMSQAQDQLDDLLAKINDVVSGAKALNDVGIESTAQVTQQIRALEILRDRFSDDAYAVKQLTEAIQKLNDEIGGNIGWGKRLENAGAMTTAQIREQIVELEALREHFIGDKYAVEQLTEAIDGLNKKLGLKVEPTGGFFAGMRDGFAKLQENMLTARDVGERVVGDLSTGFSTLFSNMIRGGQSWSEMMRGFFADVLGSFVQMLAEMQARQMMAGLFGETFGQAGGSLGGLFGSIGSWFGGGPMSFMKSQTPVPLAEGTNYVPSDGMAYLHQGEAVVPREFNPAFAGGGESRPIEIVIQNLIDSQSVPRAMAGRDGQTVISNQIAMDAKRNGITRHTIRNN